MRLHPLLLGVAVALALTAAPAPAAAPQHSDVRLFADGSAVPGAYSTLLTDSSGVSMSLHTSGLAAGHAVTVWWVIFNNPQACSGPAPGHPFRCGPSDLADPAVEGSVQHTGGHVVGGSGPVAFAARLREGDTSGCAAPTLPCAGLLDPAGADIHLLVRDHGAASPGFVDEQIHSFDVCNPACSDLQFSVHER